ncbi:MAG: NAD(P)-dependent oxidoreductase, partial [Proteobacteria bacterium]|nr:NAD(P)-dependent oxidoreductase [Pseudomonadota bacterium]
DQVGCPTSALDLADAILLVAERWRSGDRTHLGRTYHLCGTGKCSWAEFAAEIFRVSGTLGGPVAHVRPIPTSQFPTRARRPSWSVLDSSAFRREFGLDMPDVPAAAAPARPAADGFVPLVLLGEVSCGGRATVRRSAARPTVVTTGM